MLLSSNLGGGDYPCKENAKIVCIHVVVIGL